MVIDPYSMKGRRAWKGMNHRTYQDENRKLINHPKTGGSKPVRKGTRASVKAGVYLWTWH